MRELWTWSAIAALVVGVITWGAMFWAIIFHRKRTGDDDAPPRQTQYNLPVEIIFTVVPTIIVAVLFGFTVHVQNYVDKNDDPAPEVDVTAFQWNWEFTYPDTSTPTGAPVTTIGTPTRSRSWCCRPTGRSVHPALQRRHPLLLRAGVPVQARRLPVPGEERPGQRLADRPIDASGAFVGRCAELCGAYHALMNFEVRALPPELFDRYMQLRSRPTRRRARLHRGRGSAGAELRGAVRAAATTTYPFNTDRTAGPRRSRRPAAEQGEKP